MNPWEWISTTTSVDTLLTTLGLGSLAILFARDVILTSGQHLRRVQDIVKAHDLRIADLLAHQLRELAEKDGRIVDMGESRDGWKEAARLERERADKATAAVAEIASSLADIRHVLESLNRALPAPTGGDYERA